MGNKQQETEMIRFQGVAQRAVEKTRKRVQDNKVKQIQKRAINQPTQHR